VWPKAGERIEHSTRGNTRGYRAQLSSHAGTATCASQRRGQQMREGFKLAFCEREAEVVAVAGFRVHHMLSSGLTLYVDDLVTSASHRSQGIGKAMLDWLIAYARERGCETFSLDSGTHRKDAHAFYLRERLRITDFHFELKLR
jgi:GNAT superfamily N-acetyltransferase